MSEVISFRLDKANPREAQALEILIAWIEKGFSASFIFTNALLELDHPGSEAEMSQDAPDLGEVLDQIGQVLEILKSIKADSPNEQFLEQGKSNLNEGFLTSIKQGVKPGIKFG